MKKLAKIYPPPELFKEILTWYVKLILGNILHENIKELKNVNNKIIDDSARKILYLDSYKLLQQVDKTKKIDNLNLGNGGSKDFSFIFEYNSIEYKYYLKIIKYDRNDFDILQIINNNRTDFEEKSEKEVINIVCDLYDHLSNQLDEILGHIDVDFFAYEQQIKNLNIVNKFLISKNVSPVSLKTFTKEVEVKLNNLPHLSKKLLEKNIKTNKKIEITLHYTSDIEKAEKITEDKKIGFGENKNITWNGLWAFSGTKTLKRDFYIYVNYINSCIDNLQLIKYYIQDLMGVINHELTHMQQDAWTLLFQSDYGLSGKKHKFKGYSPRELTEISDFNKVLPDLDISHTSQKIEYIPNIHTITSQFIAGYKTILEYFNIPDNNDFKLKYFKFFASGNELIFKNDLLNYINKAKNKDLRHAYLSYEIRKLESLVPRALQQNYKLKELLDSNEISQYKAFVKDIWKEIQKHTI